VKRNDGRALARRRRWAILSGSGLALALLGPGAAQVAAQDDGDEDAPGMIEMEGEATNPQDAQARALFEAGSALYAAGEFDAAAQRFEEAYGLSQRPALLFNIYVAWRDAGEPGRAADALARYLEEVPDARDRVTLEARLRSLREQAAAGDQAAAPPVPAPTPVPADTSDEGDDGAAGRKFLRALPFVVGGLGAAAIIAGTATGIVALDRRNALEDECPNDRCPFDQVDDLPGERDELRRLSLATDVLLVGGVVLVIGGVVLWAVGLGEEPDGDGGDDGGDRARVTPVFGCGTDGCVAGVRGTL